MAWSLLAIAGIMLLIAAAHFAIAWNAKRFAFRELAISVCLPPLASALVFLAQWWERPSADITFFEGAAISAGVVLAGMGLAALAFYGPRFVTWSFTAADLDIIARRQEEFDRRLQDIETAARARK